MNEALKVEISFVFLFFLCHGVGSPQHSTSFASRYSPNSQNALTNGTLKVELSQISWAPFTFRECVAEGFSVQGSRIPVEERPRYCARKASTKRLRSDCACGAPVSRARRECKVREGFRHGMGSIAYTRRTRRGRVAGGENHASWGVSRVEPPDKTGKRFGHVAGRWESRSRWTSDRQGEETFLGVSQGSDFEHPAKPPDNKRGFGRVTECRRAAGKAGRHWLCPGVGPGNVF